MTYKLKKIEHYRVRVCLYKVYRLLWHWNSVQETSQTRVQIRAGVMTKVRISSEYIAHHQYSPCMLRSGFGTFIVTHVQHFH